MADRGTKAMRDRKTVFDEIVNDIDRAPLTLRELQQRLKHIAGLCWGLSIDIANEFDERDNLKEENKQQREEIEHLKGQLGLKGQRAETKEKLEKMTAAERLEYNKKREKANAYARKKYKPKTTTTHGGQNNAE